MTSTMSSTAGFRDPTIWRFNIKRTWFMILITVVNKLFKHYNPKVLVPSVENLTWTIRLRGDQIQSGEVNWCWLLTSCWPALPPASICLGSFPVILARWALCMAWYNTSLVQRVHALLCTTLWSFAFWYNATMPQCHNATCCYFSGQHYSWLNAVTDRCLPGSRLTNPPPSRDSALQSWTVSIP